jgi:tRNA pseudouridine55 synthase
MPTGEVRQRPPAYSAVKVGGERAYRRARRGEHVEMPERIVSVHRFVQRWRAPDEEHPGLERAGYEIECGSGTYVRSLIADLGDAYCLALRRTAVGPFEVTDAVAPPARGGEWEDPPLIALDEALAMLSHGRQG